MKIINEKKKKKKIFGQIYSSNSNNSYDNSRGNSREKMQSFGDDNENENYNPIKIIQPKIKSENYNRNTKNFKVNIDDLDYEKEDNIKSLKIKLNKYVEHQQFEKGKSRKNKYESNLI